MKITGAAVVALLASTTTALNWGCSKSGGGGHDTLKRVHTQFNRKFGNPRLRIAADQCYIVKCYDHYFGVCNRASYAQTEISGDRNDARNTNPRSGSNCGLTPTPVGGGAYLTFIYSRVKDIHLGGPNNDVRVC